MRRLDKERRVTLAFSSFPFSGRAAALCKPAVLSSSPVDLPGAIRAPSSSPFPINKENNVPPFYAPVKLGGLLRKGKDMKTFLSFAARA